MRAPGRVRGISHEPIPRTAPLPLRRLDETEHHRRPRYVVLSNFDEFQVYDFDTQLDTPKDTVKLEELPTRWGPLAFLFPTDEAPTFQNDREAVTREAADKLALCFTKLEKRRVDRPLARRFILQTLVALFSEDIGLLPKYIVGRLLDECDTPEKSFDLLGCSGREISAAAPWAWKRCG